jgi:predicted RNA-binding protein with PUA-like domain
MTAANYWLMKTEPADYSFADLEREETTVWDGVRNNAALKHMRAMQPGNLVFIYHTGNERAVVGIAEVTSMPYHEPQTPAAPGQKGPGALVIAVRALRRLPRPVPLAAMKADAFFAEFALVRQARLSVMPVEAEQWQRICQIGGMTEPVGHVPPPDAPASA